MKFNEISTKLKDKDIVIRIAMLTLIAVIGLVGYRTYYTPLPQITVRIIATIMQYFIGIIPITVNNSILLVIGGQIVSVNISYECVGAYIILLFPFVIFLTPKITLKHRFASLLFLPFLYASNIVRITLGILAGVTTGEIQAMELFHSTVGQVFMFGFLVACYLLFLSMFGYYKMPQKN